MTTLQALGYIALAVGTIGGLIFYAVKRVDWGLSSTPEEKKEAIDKDQQKRQEEFEKTGRPNS